MDGLGMFVNVGCKMLQSRKLVQTLSVSIVHRFVSTDFCYFVFPLDGLLPKVFVPTVSTAVAVRLAERMGVEEAHMLGLQAGSCRWNSTNLRIFSDYPLLCVCCHEGHEGHEGHEAMNSRSSQSGGFFSELSHWQLASPESHELRSSATSGTRSSRISKPRSDYQKVKLSTQKTCETL